MVQVEYKWPMPLKNHTARKLKILREYFSKYLDIRCSIPHMDRFRFAIVDGFSGGGYYTNGEPGSPIIFLQELKRAADRINIVRSAQGMKLIEIECLVIMNDLSPDTVETLKENCLPQILEINENNQRLNLRIEYFCGSFKKKYIDIREVLIKNRFQNVLFNLDQCGDTHVPKDILLNITSSFNSPEIFLTFMIGSILSFLTKGDIDTADKRLRHLGTNLKSALSLDEILSTNEWLGTAECMVFAAFHECAPFVSTFSINNPGGWRYWLIHLAKVPRARQAYNNTLHDNATEQAHFGRSGLYMLAYDPEHEKNSLYLFTVDGRAGARNQLTDDIPRLISEHGDAMFFDDFLRSIYNMTPAHDEDIRSSILDNEDLEVVTQQGGTRRVPTSITEGDAIRLKAQKSFFPMFSESGRGKKPRK